jgi:ribosomal protein S18 acetylase RimI-like enzyme
LDLELPTESISDAGLNITFSTMDEHGLGASAELLNLAFADYVVKIVFSESGLRQMAVTDSMDFVASPVVQIDGSPVGAALVARRGGLSRVAGLGLVPAARRHGAGRALLEQLVIDAGQRRDRRLVAEVIEQNTPAVRLYEGKGFGRRRRLVGFAGAKPANLPELPAPAVADLSAVAAVISGMDAEVDWPWQISGETIARLPAPATAYTLEGACVVVMNPAGPTVGIRTLAVEGRERREERAVRLLHAVMAQHPAEAWRVSAFWPEEFAGWFTSAGLVRQELSQWQLVRDLD